VQLLGTDAFSANMRHNPYGEEPFSQTGAGILKYRAFENREIVLAIVAGEVFGTGCSVINLVLRAAMIAGNAMRVANFDEIQDTRKLGGKPFLELEKVHGLAFLGRRSIIKA